MTKIPSHQLGELLEQQLKTWSATRKPAIIAWYRSYTKGFLRYLHRNYPELREVAQLQRDPHILGWLQGLAQDYPPLGTRRTIIHGLRRQLNGLAKNGYPVAADLIMPRDTADPNRKKSVRPVVDTPLAHLLEEQLHVLSATLRASTISGYRTHADQFVRYLHRNYPELREPAELKRNPHILGWLRDIAQRNPPFANETRVHIITCVRRLLSDLADNGYQLAENIFVPRDFPPEDLYLPRPVSPEVDDLLKQEFRKTDDLVSNALLLIRATGMRVGECVGLRRDCSRHMGGDHWALHVPLGKLHTERLVPLDKEARGLLDRIISLRGPAAPTDPASPLFWTPEGRTVSTVTLREALKSASQRAGCPPVLPHQLRHTYATMMARAGISLPALMQILGHRDIRMTLRYVQVSQADLQREYGLARQKMAGIHALPQLSTITPSKQAGGILSIITTLDEIKHQLQMYLRGLDDQKRARKLHALLRRLIKLRSSMGALVEL